MVEIGLTDLPKFGGAMAPPGMTGLKYGGNILLGVRATRTYEDMRTCPHHVFKIEGGKIRILLTLIINNTAFLFNFELKKITFM